MISAVWGGVDYPITQPYGPNHRGIDIGMPMGTPLYAARAGIVTTAAYWGVAIRVGGTVPFQTDWYLHIQSCAVAAGHAIARGDRVGSSGMTQVPGGPPPTGPHLHFEVQTGQLDIYATSLDPVPVLLSLYGASGGSLAPVNLELARALVDLAYIACLGRTPESGAVREQWAAPLVADDANALTMVDNVFNSQEAQGYRAKLAAGGSVGPQGPPGPAGKDGVSPTTFTISGTAKATGA